MDSSVRSAAGALAVVDPADVACAETNQRTRVLAESCKYKLAYLTGLEDFARMDIDGLSFASHIAAHAPKMSDRP